MQELRVANLTKRFGVGREVVAVDHVDLAVEAGDLLVLLGPSGCGKTTLLRCIAGLEDAQEGAISLDGKPVFDSASGFNLPTHRRDIGMVFQNYSLWPHMTVRRNVEYPLRARGATAAERVTRVDEVLKIVQCGHLADRLPAMLSGGQQQRVALARALASKPAVMLLDEPLSNLDALLRVELRAQLRAIHHEVKFTGVYVTHDQTEAFSLGTQVAVMNAGRV
jgi:iron(III) transport system ATP-binding protein